MIPTRAPLKKIYEYIPGGYRLHAVKLSSNENPLGTSPNALRTLRKSKHISRYPESSAWVLRKKLAALHQLVNTQIIIGNGSGEILQLIASAFVSAGEKVLIAKYTFSLYEFSTLLFEGIPVKIPMKDTGWLDLAAFTKGVQEHAPRMVVLCNPNNPTGTTLDSGKLTEFLHMIPETTAVVVDEAYADYAEGFSSAISLIKNFPNLIVLRTFSKMYGLAGLRVGYGMAQANIINILHRVRLPFNTSSISQQAAIAALDDEKFVQRSLKTNREGKQLLERFLAKNKIPFFRSQTNFMCIKTPMYAGLMAEELAVRGITVRSLQSFGMPFYIRVTIGKKADMKNFCTFFSDIISH